MASNSSKWSKYSGVSYLLKYPSLYQFFLLIIFFLETDISYYFIDGTLYEEVE